MKLIALKALVAAVENGSLRAAARQLDLSQPALTKTVRELELELGARLLMRSNKGVVPTAQGKLLFEQATKSLRELDSVVDQVHQLGGRMVGELSVGAVPLAVMLLIPETLRTFGAAFPDIRLRVSEELYIAQLQRLRRGEVDVAVGGIPQGLSSGEFVTEPLVQTRMVVVVRKGHPLERAHSLKQLASAKWVYTGATSDEGYAKLLYESLGMAAPAVGAVVNSTLALLSLVGSGDLVGLLPQQIAAHPLCARYLSVVPVEEEGLPLTVGAIVRSDSAVSPAVRHFIAHLHRAAHHINQGAGTPG
ncbi:LysR family transcriptional regulator [Hydrogenophaga flava]|uniref:LysR family transcriptional regulator n=1 Tax=Hydrogenophaga flava TaxID=65657 RepID=UPI0008260FE9|nr:LysR substrate-binding domain-containing protein [Hydrogenophaga flava]